MISIVGTTESAADRIGSVTTLDSAMHVRVILADLPTNAARSTPLSASSCRTTTPRHSKRVTRRTTVGTQVTEGDVLSSKRLRLIGDTITKVTKEGVLSLSEQEIDFTDRAMLGLAVQDLAESYAIDTDLRQTAAIEASITEGTDTVLS